MKIHPSISNSVKLAARFGFISRTLFDEFATDSKRSFAYEIWRKVKEGGMFEPYNLTLASTNYLKLSKLGKSFAGTMNVVPVRPSFLSQILHDEFVARFALANEKDQVFPEALTEAFLKANPEKLNKSFVGSQRKYPDLYVQLAPHCKFAVEYERTRKSMSTYRTMLVSYSIFREIDFVLFIIEAETIKEAIQSTAIRIQYPFTKKPLAYALAKDVRENPTSFPVELNKTLLSFKDLVQKLPKAMENAA